MVTKLREKLRITSTKTNNNKHVVLLFSKFEINRLTLFILDVLLIQSFAFSFTLQLLSTEAVIRFLWLLGTFAGSILR